MSDSEETPSAGALVSGDQAADVRGTAGSTRVDIRGLTVRAGERTLLRQADFTFPAGELILLLGWSGTGKSVLLRILAGLIRRDTPGIRYTGSIEFVSAHGHRWTERTADNPVAVVFQSFALLDELSSLQNVEIASDHSRFPSAVKRSEAAELLSQLGVPTDRPVSVLSGGQQQRLAIARALAPGADVVLYDEPTSGLDRQTARRVADLIRTTQQKYRRTSIVITHDFESLSRIADRIILLDHATQQLREIPQGLWNSLADELGSPPEPGTPESAPTALEQLRTLLGESLRQTGQFSEQIISLPWLLLPVWRSSRWGLRYTLYYLRLVAGLSACVYIAVACAILGFVAQDFVFRYLPFRQFTEPLLSENLLSATGFSLYRFLVPILATILIAARSGAAVASDIGSKVYGNQLDAMRTLGISPERILRTPVLYAFLVGTPFLAVLGYFVSAASAAFAFLMTHSVLGIGFWNANFHRELILPTGVFYKGTGWLMAKLVTCGIGVALITWSCAVTPKLSGSEISHGVTRTILWATLFVLFVHFGYSLFEFTAQK